MVDDVFEEEVERQVKLTVGRTSSTALQEQLVEHQAQLQEVQRSLHNSSVYFVTSFPLHVLTLYTAKRAAPTAWYGMATCRSL